MCAMLLKRHLLSHARQDGVYTCEKSLVKTFAFNTPNTTPIHTFARIVRKYYHRCLIWLTTSDRPISGEGINSFYGRGKVFTLPLWLSTCIPLHMYFIRFHSLTPASHFYFLTHIPTSKWKKKSRNSYFVEGVGGGGHFRYCSTKTSVLKGEWAIVIPTIILNMDISNRMYIH